MVETPVVRTTKRDGAGVVARVLGTVGIVCGCVPILGSIPALICGVFACLFGLLGRAGSPIAGTRAGARDATKGLVRGVIAIVLAILGFVLWAVLWAALNDAPRFQD